MLILSMLGRMGKNTLESSLQLLLKKSEKGSLAIRSIMAILSGKGRYFLVLLLSLPFCQPLQIPGTSIPFGLVIAFLGIRIGFGHHIWLPQSVLDKKISHRVLKKIIKKSLWLMNKLKKIIHPRLSFLCIHPTLQIINGSLITILGLLLALPLPLPLTNIITAWALIFLSLGLLEDDGLFMLLGYVFFLLCVAFFIFLGLSIDFLAKR